MATIVSSVGIAGQKLEISRLMKKWPGSRKRLLFRARFLASLGMTAPRSVFHQPARNSKLEIGDP